MRKLYNYQGFSINIDDYTTPEKYGAVGNGTSDDSTAFQNALNEKGLILCSPSSNYKITGVLRIYDNTIIDLNGATITSTSNHLFFNFLGDSVYTGYNGNGNIVICNGTLIGGAVSFAHGENILFKNVIFKNSLNDHFMEVCGCKNYKIRDCYFIGMKYLTTSVLEYINIDPCYRQEFPWLNDSTSVFYDGTVNNGLYIDNCVFSIGENTYAYGFNAIGVHSSNGNKHSNINITNCKVTGFTGCGLRINNMDDVIIFGNVINLTDTDTNGICVGDVAQSTNVIIKNNVISSAGTAITKANNSTVFQSADNDINPTFS